jgi:hypothetical protein
MEGRTTKMSMDSTGIITLVNTSVRTADVISSSRRLLLLRNSPLVADFQEAPILLRDVFLMQMVCLCWVLPLSLVMAIPCQIQEVFMILFLRLLVCDL